jgi:hypothetical protein
MWLVLEKGNDDEVASSKREEGGLQVRSKTAESGVSG